MSMIDGGTQHFALTLNKFLEHAAKWHPQVQVVTGREGGAIDRIGYAELMERSLRVSAVLADFGIRPGHRVATLAWNTQAHIEVSYAIMGMGAVCHTLNPRLTCAQLAEMLNQSEARMIVVSADLVPLAREIAERVTAIEHMLIIDVLEDVAFSSPGRPVMSALDPLIAATHSDDIIWGHFEETVPSGLCFTSGTTGAPKGVTYTHRASFLHTLRLLQADMLAISVADCVLAVVPMFHANAWGLPFAAPAVGAKLVLPGHRTDGASLAHLIAKEAVTIAVGVPTVWLGLIEYLESSGCTLPTLKRIVTGGAALAPALRERIERQLKVRIQTSWGMTELSPSGTVSSLNDSKSSPAASGRPAVGVDLLLTDADGRALPEQREVEGHLRVRGAAVIERYFGQEDKATDVNGWFPTGDLARIDAAGNVFIIGRDKDLIKSGGEWINPAEIEALVGALPEVSQAAVIGRSDPRWGERPILLVEMRGKQPISDEALLAPLHGRVAPWWIPDAVLRIPHMPLAPTGKIDKMALRYQFGNNG
jgi:acyl-CoA synthetase (AMP-forming)/AMP-acid ligase II